MIQKLDWIKLYRAALREADPGKRAALIEEAEQAMRNALQLKKVIPISGTRFQKHYITLAGSGRLVSEEVICPMSSVALCRAMFARHQR